MRKKYKILFIILIVFYPCYKGLRELVWVKHSKYNIGNSFQIKLRVDPDLLGFQDINIDKTITLINNVTKKSIDINYVTLEPNLYFFLDNVDSPGVISIIDKFAGQNLYNYHTLQLINKKDCFQEFGGCGGFDHASLTKLGKPFLVYDNNGFHK